MLVQILTALCCFCKCVRVWVYSSHIHITSTHAVFATTTNRQQQKIRNNCELATLVCTLADVRYCDEGILSEKNGSKSN